VTGTPGIGEATATLVDRMGIEHGMVVQELGYDEDVDHEVRTAIEDRIDDDMLDEDADPPVDVAVVWYRADDGDLVDLLVDALSPLADNGVIWLLTPKRGRAGYVEPSDIAEAAPIAGLSQTSLLPVGSEWTGARLVTRRNRPAAEKGKK